MERFYTCEQVATRYQVPLTAVWRWIRNKKLRAIKFGRNYRITEKDLIDFEKSNLTIKQ